MPSRKKSEFKADRPSRAEMAHLFRQCGLILDEEAVSKFWTFHQLLREKSPELDLTRLRRFEDLVLKHYVDCALTPSLIELPSPLLDIGTGAGFPGLPIKIIRPDLELILAESRGQRLAFLREAVRLLELEGVEIYPHKVTKRFHLPVAGIITRAVESISRTLEKAAAFLPEGGRVIFMKGPAVGGEMAEASESALKEFTLVEDKAYTLGPTGHRRRLIVFEKIKPPAVKALAKEDSMMQEIHSAQNQSFKVWLKVLDGRGVKKHGLALMSGQKQVREVLRDFPGDCDSLLYKGRSAPVLEVPAGVRSCRLAPELFGQLDLFGAGPPLLVIRVQPLPLFTDEDWPEGCTLFVPFQDPANVGAVIRTAAAFGAARVVLLKEAAHPFHPRSLRASGPAVFRVTLLEGPSLSELTSNQAPLFGLSPAGLEASQVRFPKTFGLVPGLEGPGLPERWRQGTTVAIPMAPGVESLNAALAAGIVLYEWRRKMRLESEHPPIK
ncbi:MAG: 16S rRNA (guanine(527)-N(7))-methyltransferase RsmG [Pseudomonadota bacterium]